MARINYECIRIEESTKLKKMARKMGIDYVTLIISWNWSNLFSEEGGWVEQWLEAKIKFNDGRIEEYGKEWSINLDEEEWEIITKECKNGWCETNSVGTASTEVSNFLNYLYLLSKVPEDNWEYPTTIEYIIFNSKLAKEILKDKKEKCVVYDVYDEEEDMEYTEFCKLLDKLKNS